MKEKFVSIIEKLIALAAVRLSDDVVERLEETSKNEDSPLQQAIYDSYLKNLQMAKELSRPSCQDTGMIQFYVEAGTGFPYLDITAEALTEAVRRATKSAPLRPNAVNIFDEKIASDNIAERSPWINWELIPASDEMKITLYLSGAGCSLPGLARVFKPSDGLDAVIPFVTDAVLGAGINACPPLLVGLGLGHNIENAAVLSKKALLRKLGASHPDPKGARLEKQIEAHLNSLGIGAQGLRGNKAVMGVHVETSARHTATLACAVNFSCYMLRRATVRLDNTLACKLDGFKGVTL